MNLTLTSSSPDTTTTPSASAAFADAASEPKGLNQWITELTAEYLRIDVAESARKWVEYCRANNKPMTREKLNGWLKRERPAKSQSGLSKAELMARINVEIGKLRTISPVTFDDLSQIVRQRLSDLPKKWHDLEPDIIKRALGLTRSEVPVSLVRVGDKCQGVDWKPEYEQQAA